MEDIDSCEGNPEKSSTVSVNINSKSNNASNYGFILSIKHVTKKSDIKDFGCLGQNTEKYFDFMSPWTKKSKNSADHQIEIKC